MMIQKLCQLHNFVRASRFGISLNVEVLSRRFKTNNSISKLKGLEDFHPRLTIIKIFRLRVLELRTLIILIMTMTTTNFYRNC